MIRTGKIILVVLAILFASRLCYAAVRLATESGYGISGYSEPLNDGPVEIKLICPLAYIPPAVIECRLVNSSASCNSITCSYTQDEVQYETTVNECPRDFSDKTNQFIFDNMYKPIVIDTFEYCYGYKSGVYGVWYKENPNQCSSQGITDTYYLSLISADTSCKGGQVEVNNVYTGSCNKEDGNSTTYCKLTDTSNMVACPADDYEVSDGGCVKDDGEGFTSYPCYASCGADRYCLGFACSLDNLPLCDDLISEREAEGWHSTGLSANYDAEDFPETCAKDGKAYFIGFHCKGYPLESSDDCAAGNGVESSCTMFLEDGSAKDWYKCSCTSEAKTLQQYCNEQYPGDDSCLITYYGDPATKCTFDTDIHGNTLIKYTSFLSEPQVCSIIDNWKYYQVSSGAECKNYTDETAAVKDQCRIVDSGTYESTITDICKYCENYLTDNTTTAQGLCVNGSPIECHYPKDDTDGVVYMQGCTCSDDYKTIEEWCATDYSEYADCLTEAVGGGKECHTLPNPSGSGYLEGDIVYYECLGCGDSYMGLPDYCAANHPSDDKCLRTYYGVEDSACVFSICDNIYTEYSEFSSEYKLCDDIKGWILGDTADSGCKNYTDQTSAVADKCRLLDSTTYTTGFKDICKYCENYLTADKTKAESLCPNGTPVECNYFKGGTDGTVYMGTCNCGDNYRTIEEWCSTKFADERNCLSQAVGAGKECHTSPDPSGSGYLADDIVNYEKVVCNSEYMTQEEWCAANLGSDEPCEDYVGVGDPCVLEQEESGNKYKDFNLSCPDTPNVKTSPNDCLIEGDDTPYYDICYYKQDSSKVGYICKCPDGFITSCESPYKIPGGTLCKLDVDEGGSSIYKYSDCYLACNNTYASEYASTVHGCPEPYDGYLSTIRGGTDNPEMCMSQSNDKLYYICGCPAEFKTIDDWCQTNHPNDNNCKSDYSGVGEVCKRDITTDDDGNPTGVLIKYADYARYCPDDKPLYYKESDCTSSGGEYDYTCKDENDNERVVCKCLDDFKSAADCAQITGLPHEPSGEYCELDGEDAVKYKECVVRCEDFLSEAAIKGAYEYIDASNSTPTSATCTNKMGDGAKFGYTDTAYCSLNNTKVYPCYCPKDFVECLTENEEMPAKDALACYANGTQYYSRCVPISCQNESSTIALEPSSDDYNTDKATIQAKYGSGATMKKCTNNDVEAWEVSCDASIYTDVCEYPYEAPAGDDWCLYGEGSTLMKNGVEHYRKGACKILDTLGECGKNVIEKGNTVTSPYTIFAVATESECQAKYGSGAVSQICEYGAEQGYKRAYNCYYNANEFKYTTDGSGGTVACGVRNDLTGKYIIVNGKKRWNSCRCASAYQHHKYNCGGLLSGTPCQQEITQDIIDSDTTLPASVLGKTLPFYPYCECSAEYTEVCDEDGSGRYKGVGTECNGKYKSCECIPDPLPENWSDNYYGCSGGKKPTGVWKDNGCGQKYYQCSVIECTWEYTEKCESPLIPVGQPCQDNQGNIGGYKSCSCPSGYQICPEGKVGEGEPCNLKGVSYYKSCKEQDSCPPSVVETCNSPLLIGVNPCVREDITYYESCVCANGYNKVCEQGEVGVGNYCELNGVKYYKECAKPDENQCTEGHVVACDTNQISYSPCVEINEEGKGVVKYLCKCPNNWYTSSTCSTSNLAGEHCIQKDSAGNQTDYYSQCTATDVCTDYQEKTYKVCSESQTGEGGSCLSGDGDETITKYASCIDSNNCFETGFIYSCSGYDTSFIEESCVDTNGNRFYKSCPCPSSYVTCNGNNTVKGNKCIPLLSDGSYGEAVYSSCTCDRSKYKYTCDATETGNRGVIAPDTQNYCELFDEEGEESTKYYTSCECDEAYKYICSDNKSGEIIPEGYEDDYCLINSTKFYKGCDCAEEYTTTVDQCDSLGAVVDSAEGYCIIKGEVPSSSTVYREHDKKLYQGCICKSSYRLECEGDEYDQTGIKGCTLDEDKTLYPECKCSSIYKSTCAKSGRNQGIKYSDNTCTAKQIDASGSTVYKEYTECVCEQGYTQQCDADYYNQSDEDYCDIDGVRSYKNCICSQTYYDNTQEVPSNMDQDEYCESLGKVANDSLENPFCIEIKGTKSTKRPHYYICSTT